MRASNQVAGSFVFAVINSASVFIAANTGTPSEVAPNSTVPIIDGRKIRTVANRPDSSSRRCPFSSASSTGTNSSMTATAARSSLLVTEFSM